MESQANYNPWLSIPSKKVDRVVRQVIDSFQDCRGKLPDEDLPQKCRIMIEAIRRYAEANIPVDYWPLDMADFKGDKTLLKRYEQIAADIHGAYDSGLKICFAGSYGLGKSMVSACILKKAVESGYSALYLNLTDIVTLMGSRDADKKYEARQQLLTTDFLVVDEFDPRFMGSDNAADFYGRILEQTLRARVQNTLPLFLCTNSPNP